MTTWAAVYTAAAVLMAAFVLLVALACLWPADHHDDIHPLTVRQGAHGRVDAAVPQQVLVDCTAPDGPMTVAQAHRDMQLHRECRCPRQRFARQTLIDAGHLKPDTHREPFDSWILT
ncbi:hypothetical protein [Nocardia wallacei]|uniref:hypothetical protein n=1 Tax=Nocardia wallacei TaxID=480035 RepID=UPI0024538582|nr:hypothetical protein [Nocardia wallacei]